MPLRRPFTLAESARLIELSVVIGRIDARLGELVAALASGDDTVLGELHTRLNVLGRCELADRVRRLVRG